MENHETYQQSLHQLLSSLAEKDGLKLTGTSIMWDNGLPVLASFTFDGDGKTYFSSVHTIDADNLCFATNDIMKAYYSDASMLTSTDDEPCDESTQPLKADLLLDDAE